MAGLSESHVAVQSNVPSDERVVELLDLPDEILSRIFLDVFLLSRAAFDRWKLSSHALRGPRPLPGPLVPLQLNRRLRRICRPIWCRTIALPGTPNAVESCLAPRVFDFPGLVGKQEVSALSGVIAALPAAVLQLLPNLTSVHICQNGTNIGTAWTDLLVQLPSLVDLSLETRTWGNEMHLPFASSTFSFRRLSRLRSLRLAGTIAFHRAKFAFPPTLSALHVDVCRVSGRDSNFPAVTDLRISRIEAAAPSIVGCGVDIALYAARNLVLDFFAFGPPQDSTAPLSPLSWDRAFCAGQLCGRLRAYASLGSLELRKTAAICWPFRDENFPSVKVLRLEGDADLADTSNFTNLAAFLKAFSRLETLTIVGFRFHTKVDSSTEELPTFRFADPRDAFPLAAEHPVLSSLVRLLALLPLLHVRIRQSETSKRILQFTRLTASETFMQENLIDLAA